jgi:uncharacterized repeat protein (TIGR03803 family)
MKKLAAALLAGCIVAGCSSPPAAPSVRMLPLGRVRVPDAEDACRAIYSFKGGSDGARPVAGLLLVRGKFYGTTSRGGDHDRGTVFRLSTSGKERVLHAFGGKLDGAYPQAALIAAGTTLFGTTSQGGAGGRGAVFAVSPAGVVTIVYSFAAASSHDGANPYAPLTYLDGMLYGTTLHGGEFDAGTVFSLNPTTHAERVLHSFGASNDGALPYAGLAAVNGTLYGATFESGGTVFSITPRGVERVLHHFGGSAQDDGDGPYAAPIDVHGTLVGTTERGGARGFNSGTVYAIGSNGRGERVVHFFRGIYNADFGNDPTASVIERNGVLYGTTLFGGEDLNDGTAFRMALDGSGFKQLCDFSDGSVGGQPRASFIDVDGTLYTATEFGGTYDRGSVFSVRAR